MLSPSFFAEGATPHRSDTQTILLQKILGRLNTLRALLTPVSAISPSFFTDGSTPHRSDTQTILLQKINGALASLETALISGGLGFSNVATVAELRTVPTAPTNRGALVQANTVAGDGMGGIYYWASGNTDADDGIQTIRPTDYTTGGTWKKLI